MQQYFGKIEPYPLFFLDWKLSSRLKLRADGDYAEIREFLHPKFSVTVGARFNLEFYALRNRADYEYRSVGAETGIQYAVGSNCYLRLKYKELVWGREYFELPEGTDIHAIRSGRSLRLNFAYGV